MIGDYDAHDDVYEVGRTRRGLAVKMKQYQHGGICWFYEEVSLTRHILLFHKQPRQAFTFLARQGRMLAAKGVEASPRS